MLRKVMGCKILLRTKNSQFAVRLSVQIRPTARVHRDGHLTTAFHEDGPLHG